eukprot:366344-Chlamydomonas_euryale.AAC.11
MLLSMRAQYPVRALADTRCTYGSKCGCGGMPVLSTRILLLEARARHAFLTRCIEQNTHPASRLPNQTAGLSAASALAAAFPTEPTQEFRRLFSKRVGGLTEAPTPAPQRLNHPGLPLRCAQRQPRGLVLIVVVVTVAAVAASAPPPRAPKRSGHNVRSRRFPRRCCQHDVCNTTQPRARTKGRGTTDAMFTLPSLANTVARHQLSTAPDEVTPTLAISFVDFTKPYDSISWEALWEVLIKLYGAPARDQIARRSAHGHGGGRASGW